MRIGLQIPSFSWPGGPATIGLRLAEIGRAADEAGFASIWVMDHLFQIPPVGPAEEPMLEGYSALSYLAPGAESVADIIARCRALAELGIQHAIFSMPNTHEIAPLEIFGREIIPAVAEL
jgi:hypothetical protein